MVKVREIWVGNLPSSLSDQSLYNMFFIYGEIVRMDYNQERVILFNLELCIY
jgi:RNA recognition motif-containing protein